MMPSLRRDADAARLLPRESTRFLYPVRSLVWAPRGKGWTMDSVNQKPQRAERGGSEYPEKAGELAPLLRQAALEVERRRAFPESVVTALLATLYPASAAAILGESVVERRFRAVHTLSRPYRGQETHLETVGQAVLGIARETAMFPF
jgi:hypothetical protein